MNVPLDLLLPSLEAPGTSDLKAAEETLSNLPPSETFRLGDLLASNEDSDLQAALSQWLYHAGVRDPEGLSVFLAANAHILPVSTITAAGKALPEAQ